MTLICTMEMSQRSQPQEGNHIINVINDCDSDIINITTVISHDMLSKQHV